MRRGGLDDPSAFAAVARTCGFTWAVAELGLSSSALSHAMRGLETRLGLRLLARTVRSVAPTPAGERLLRSLDPALAKVRWGLATLADWRGTPSGSLRITTFAYAARAIFAPSPPGFRLDHTYVSVEVVVDDRLADIVAAGFNAGIRFGETVERDMVAVRVGPDERTMVVGTPGSFVDHPRPETPADPEVHPRVNYRLIGGGLLPRGVRPGRPRDAGADRRPARGERWRPGWRHGPGGREARLHDRARGRGGSRRRSVGTGAGG